MIRKLLERCVEGVSVHRTLSSDFGGAQLVANSGAGGLKYLFKRSSRLDPSLLSLAKRFVEPEAVVWDVGANVGLFSVAAASRAGRRGKVFAMEADLDVVRLLEQTIRLRPNRQLAPICVLPVAISRSAGLASFAIARRARAANALQGFGSTQIGGIVETRLIPSLSLDELRGFLPVPTVLKVDVEGAEMLVLEGAREVLRQDRPTVLCEVSFANAHAVAALFGSAGYRLYDGEQLGAPAPATADPAPWNTVAIPLERDLPALP